MLSKGLTAIVYKLKTLVVISLCAALTSEE